MVDSVTSLTRNGLRDWLLQRVSAVVIAIYSIFLMSFVLCQGGVSFAAWQSLFSTVSMKVATLLVLLALLLHAWVGVWTVTTDYVKPYWLRLFVQILVFVGLASWFVWGVAIIWRP